jgi:EpsI family protein
MLGRASLLFVTFLCGAAFVARESRPESAPPRASFELFPLQLNAWTGRQLPPLEPNILKILGVDDYLNRAYYRQDHAAAGVYIGYYKSQRQGDAIHSPLNCLPGAGWEPLAQGYITIPVATAAAGATDISVNRYLIQKGIDRQLVLYWYQSHGRVVASEYWGKFYLVRDAVRLNRTDAALVRVIVPIPPNVDGAEASAEQQAVDLVKTIFPVLPDYIPS